MHRRVVKILTGLAIAMVSLGVIYFLWVGISTAKLRRAYAALEKDGRPMKLADVIPPQVPDTENAALLYESAVLLLRSQPAGEHNLMKHLSDLSTKLIEEPLDTENRSEMERLLQQDMVIDALQAIQMGTERPACRFDIEYEAGLDMIMPPLSDIRSIARILSAKASIEAQAGRVDDAWNTVGAELKLADAPRTEPTIIGQLVRAGMIELACRTIQELCDVAPPTDDQYRSIEILLNGFGDIAPWVRAADGERLLFGEWVFNLSKDDLKEQVVRGILGDAHVPEAFRMLQFHRAAFKPLLLADHAAYLRTMRDHTQQLIDLYDREKTNAQDRVFFDKTRGRLITNMILPAMGRVKVIHLRMISDTRITRGGLALLRYKETHGAFPDELAALELKDLQDPFSGKTLLYQAQGEGFVLYSIGDDQEDNGGSPRQKRQEKDYDIVWRFLGPNAQ